MRKIWPRLPTWCIIITGDTMENVLIPASLFTLILALVSWKTKTFAPRRAKVRAYSARYFETTSKVSREG